MPWPGARRNDAQCRGSLACPVGRHARARRCAFRSGVGANGRMAGARLGNESGQMRFLLAFAVIAAQLHAQGQSAAQKVQPPPESIASFAATSANVGGAPDSIRIDLFRWSTDAERDKLMEAWNR